MRNFLWIKITMACCLGLVPVVASGQPRQASPAKPVGGNPGAPGVVEPAAIQWFATLDRGLAEAKRTGKPILFASGAPHCAGVPGMW